MNPFITDDFLLESDKAIKLYNGYAKDLPIIDYHCHLSPCDIAEDIRFDNLADLWLSHDHYKWRLMRAAGVDEELITGNAPAKDKFFAWAKVIGMAWGNPLYHWTALELARYFDIYEPLNESTAEEIWDKTSRMLSEKNMTASYFLKVSNVELLCTTDDPADDLSFHKKIKEDGKITTRVLPTFRPDRALKIGSPDYLEYIKELSRVSGIEINDIDSFKAALVSRIEYFHSMGCRLADHGMENIPPIFISDKDIGEVFMRRLEGGSINCISAGAFEPAMMIFLAKEYAKTGWTMQLHFACRRDNNERLFNALGKDIGCDAITGYFNSTATLSRYMSNLDKEGLLPKMIIYSLDPNMNEQIDTLIGCFQQGPDVMKIQHGSAWWFNDNIEGMKDQMKSLAMQSYFPGFIGMLTDSRSFTSYPRHEYFRRILCNMLAESVNKGLFPDDDKTLETIIRNVCHDNAARYFN
ncbi:MAG: glucuronate isomerase [Clostridiales bacterium]|nr:glucuronate isomerase [Clostridiales bacterium]